MFTGIVETMGTVETVNDSDGNRTFTIKSKELAGELKVDQSVSHNGACLTVEKIDLSSSTYQVTAIQETLEKTMIGNLAPGDRVNLERSLRANAMVDGHFVQGHVDVTGRVRDIKTPEGSFEYYVEYPAKFESLLVAKGSICINGISLTVVDNNPAEHYFSVHIIPYTYENTNINALKVGDPVNLEFDILGKYVEKIMSLRADAS